MAVQKLYIDEFLRLAESHIVIDVRSPAEYHKAHIPGALSVPLFSDEERKIIGTAYKHESKEKAIKIGLKYFGTQLVKIVESVEGLTDKQSGSPHFSPSTILVHCWRGGMRSAAVAWLLDLYGLKVYTLTGGYKAFRRWCTQQFEKKLQFQLIGGYTGSNKTEVLKNLEKRGECIIDLEELASHQGSAFGNLGQPPQPTQEMFENLLAVQLQKIQQTALLQQKSFIWIEDESQRIGNVNIPIQLFHYLRTQPVLFLDLSFERRLQNIINRYGSFDKLKLENAINRISKRLGGLNTKNALVYLQEDKIVECFRILLCYYDKWYAKSLQLRDNWQNLVTSTNIDTTDSEKICNLLIYTKQTAL